MRRIGKLKKITLNVSEETESTASLWWIIIDPRQNFRTDNQALHDIAGMITGPFFSREEAEDFLNTTRYNFGKNAKVYCHSGHNSKQYHDAYRQSSTNAPSEMTESKSGEEGEVKKCPKCRRDLAKAHPDLKKHFVKGSWKCEYCDIWYSDKDIKDVNVTLKEGN